MVKYIVRIFSVKFPYLVFLMSGGHCLLAVVENVNQFKLLGSGIDCSPGDMLDKVSLLSSS